VPLGRQIRGVILKAGSKEPVFIGVDPTEVLDLVELHNARIRARSATGAALDDHMLGVVSRRALISRRTIYRCSERPAAPCGGRADSG
jgi:hypothetical protein